MPKSPRYLTTPSVIDIVRGKMTHVLAVQYHIAVYFRSIRYICQHWINIMRYPHYLSIFYEATVRYLELIPSSSASEEGQIHPRSEGCTVNCSGVTDPNSIQSWTFTSRKIVPSWISWYEHGTRSGCQLGISRLLAWNRLSFSISKVLDWQLKDM